MKIGIIGAGRMAHAIAELAVRCGYQVMISNSRGPDTIKTVGRRLGCSVGHSEEAAEFGDLIVAAFHLQATPDSPLDRLSGKIVINPQNYFPQFGNVPEIDSGVITTAEYLARLSPKAVVVKALNSILVEELVPDARKHGAYDRRALPLAGDDRNAKEDVSKFLSEIGYDSVDAGSLVEGWRFERRRPSYCIPLDQRMLGERLTATTKQAFVPDGNWQNDRGMHS